MAIQLQGGTSLIVADVDTSKRLTVAASVLDKDGNPILVTEDDHLMISPEALLFYEQVDGAAVNLLKWVQNSTTMTIAQAAGFITLNNSAITTVTTNANITSVRQLPLYGTKPLRLQINAKTNVGPQANATMELGLGFVATNAAPTDGAFFRWASDATFRAVVNRGGTETQSAALTAPPVADSTLFEIILVEDLVQFFVDDVLVATVTTPVTAAYPVDSGHQPVFARTYTGGSAPGTAPQMLIGQVVAIQESLNSNKLWKEMLVSLGQGSYQSPVTAFAQTANHANSTSPASATLSNTAAGYTTLGGRYQFAAPAGAATDFALFGFQVPTGYQLYVTGVAITAMNTGAALAGSATILDWSVGVNSSAVSLATADATGNVWGPRRIGLGMQGFPLAAPNGPIQIGDVAPDIVRAFDPPLIVDSGRFFHVIVQVPVGTATGSQVIRGDVTVTGYFE